MGQIDKDTFRRIAETVKRLERTPRNTVSRANSLDTVIPGHFAKLTTSVSPGSATAPGSGTATLHYYDGSGYVSLGIFVTVKNFRTKTIASGTLVDLVWRNGYWFVNDVYDCSKLS